MEGLFLSDFKLKLARPTSDIYLGCLSLMQSKGKYRIKGNCVLVYSVGENTGGKFLGDFMRSCL